ncbi:MAG: B-box zinc finger protein [Anaerolineales bacterium]|jgi:hypothetical protein
MTQVPPGETFCAYHPNRPATLRCNRCGNPICPQCAILTPVGYRCKSCIRTQQQVFETARWFDFVIAFAISAFLAGLSSVVIGFLGIFVILVAPLVGVAIGSILQRLLRGHRSRYMPLTAGVGAAVGCLPQVFLYLLPFLGGGLGGIAGGLLGLVFALAYVVLLIGALLASLRGIRL